ncbi:MAG: hypothetical protein JKY56_03440 [Kofleriaceae bacterium]|nr:hypothetical protein [Kofleriaceae bacterium]
MIIWDLKRSQLGNLTKELLLQRRTMLPAESPLERIVSTEVVRQEKLSFRRLLGSALLEQIEGLILVGPTTQISTFEWLT